MVKDLDQQLKLRIAADIFSHLFAAQSELEAPGRANFAGIAERLAAARLIIQKRCDVAGLPRPDKRGTGISRASILRQVGEDVKRVAELMESALSPNGREPCDAVKVFKAIAIDLDNLLSSEPLASAGVREGSRG